MVGELFSQIHPFSFQIYLKKIAQCSILTFLKLGNSKKTLCLNNNFIKAPQYFWNLPSTPEALPIFWNLQFKLLPKSPKLLRITTSLPQVPSFKRMNSKKVIKVLQVKNSFWNLPSLPEALPKICTRTSSRHHNFLTFQTYTGGPGSNCNSINHQKSTIILRIFPSLPEALPKFRIVISHHGSH